MSDPIRKPAASSGDTSEEQWPPARAGRNREAIEYYRQRSRAPGVAEGGEARNFYCMECDGVVPFDQRGDACPHCGAPIEGRARRYFNWVEIDQPGEGDLRALLPWLLAGLAALVGLGWLLVAWLT